jgi:hypothetical protein
MLAGTTGLEPAASCVTGVRDGLQMVFSEVELFNVYAIARALFGHRERSRLQLFSVVVCTKMVTNISGPLSTHALAPLTNRKRGTSFVRRGGNQSPRNLPQEGKMIRLTAEVKNDQGQVEEKKFELKNPEFEKWLEDAGEGLDGFEFIDE